MPAFSIIMPFHAAAETIAATLDSLRAQTVQDWEAICVDDRSPDDAAQIVGAYAAQDARIRLIQNPGTGPSDARNHAAGIARGTFLAFCDADDLWLPEKLGDLAKGFAAHGHDGLYGRIGFFTRNPEDSRTQSTVPPSALSLSQLLAENPVCTMSNLTLRRKVFLKVGGLDRDAVHNEDLELLVRLVGAGHAIHGLDRLHVWYRTAPNGLSSDLAAMQAGRRRALRSAARYGVLPTPAAEAVYLRYLARRALRLDAPAREAWRYTRAGLWHSPSAFLLPPRRGAATALATGLAFVLTPRLRRALFAR